MKSTTSSLKWITSPFRWTETHTGEKHARRVGNKRSGNTRLSLPRLVGNVLSEEGGKVWAVVGKFGRKPGSGAVWACLLGVRGTDRHVQGGVHIAKGGGENVGGSEVSARDEATNLGLSGMVSGLRSSVNEGSDRIGEWPRPRRSRWRERRWSPGSQTGRQRRVQVRWAQRRPAVGELGQHTPQSPKRVRGGD